MPRLAANEVVQVHSLTDFPAEAACERRLVEGAGDRSVFALPLLQAGVLAGAIFFSSRQKEKTWTSEHLSLIRFLGDILLNALARKQTGKALARYQNDLESLVQEALAEVKTLSGLLPICASCKKIRDDQGYWQQIERYVTVHSEAEFSHGVCPPCAKKLYPDEYRSLFPDLTEAEFDDV